MCFGVAAKPAQSWAWQAKAVSNCWPSPQQSSLWKLGHSERLRRIRHSFEQRLLFPYFFFSRTILPWRKRSYRANPRPFSGSPRCPAGLHGGGESQELPLARAGLCLGGVNVNWSSAYKRVSGEEITGGEVTGRALALAVADALRSPPFR